jgi:antitoxin VapB
MGTEYRAKIFKSGNSLALRLPKALGLSEGTEMTLREEQGKFTFQPVTVTPEKIDLTGIYGSCPDLKLLTRHDREFDPSPRIWDDPAWAGWKGLPDS